MESERSMSDEIIRKAFNEKYPTMDVHKIIVEALFEIFKEGWKAADHQADLECEDQSP